MFNMRTIGEVVKMYRGMIVVIQCTKYTKTSFKSTDESADRLILGRLYSHPVQKVEVREEDGQEKVFIYGLNYTRYEF